MAWQWKWEENDQFNMLQRHVSKGAGMVLPFPSSPHLAISVEVGEEGSRILNRVGQVFVRRRSSGVGRRESKFSS